MNLKKITKDEEQSIVRLYEEGKTCGEIANLIGRHRDTVRRVLKRTNKYENNVNYCSQNELDCIVNDYKQGIPPYILANKYNRSSGFIINKLKSIGVYECKNLRLSADETEWLIEKYSDGDLESIFQKYPTMTKQDLYMRMYKAGIKSGAKSYWSDEELDFLKAYYYDYDLSSLEEIFNYRHSQDAIQTKANRAFEYYSSNRWTDEENDILQQWYSRMPLKKLMKLLPNRSHDAIINHARIYGLYSCTNIETHWNKVDTEFLINNWELMSDYELAQKLNKEQRAIKSKRILLRLLRVDKNCGFNYESLNKYLRGQIQDWKNQSMESCDYKCVITGEKSFQIHHLYPVNQIIQDLFENHKEIEYKNLSEYSSNELENIVELFKLEQNKHPLGVCVREDIHNLYHSLFGKTNNNPHQWNVFVDRLKNNQYESLINI